MSDPTNAMEPLIAMQEGPVVYGDDAREAILIDDKDLPHVNLPDGSGAGSNPVRRVVLQRVSR